MLSGVAFDRSDRRSRLRMFPYDRFKFYTIVPIVRVFWDRPGSVSIKLARSPEHCLKELGRLGHQGETAGLLGRRVMQKAPCRSYVNQAL